MASDYAYPIDPNGERCMDDIATHDFRVVVETHYADKGDGWAWESRDGRRLALVLCSRCLLTTDKQGRVIRNPRKQFPRRAEESNGE